LLVWHSELISKDNNMGSEFKKARVNYPSQRDGLVAPQKVGPRWAY